MLKSIFKLISIVTLNFLMHLYVFLKVSLFLNIKNNGLFYILAFFTSVIIIPASIFIRKDNNLLTQLFYKFSGILLGIFFITFISMLFFEIMRLVYPVPEKRIIAAALIASAILIFYSVLNAKNTTIETVKISDFGKKIKIIQISDLHLSSNPFDKISEIVEQINSINPDIVIITGDLVSQDTPINDKTFEPLKNLNSKSYFITGNHEYYIGKEEICKFIENTGVKVLRDEVDFFKGIQIVGMDYRSDKAETRAVLSNLRIYEDKPALMLNHVPIDAKDQRIRLTISGHTHYGQIVPFNLIVRLTTKYLKGLYSLETGYLYVSPGTGTWGPPMRLGSKNEITVFDLK